jgi:hypothetical protein
MVKLFPPRIGFEEDNSPTPNNDAGAKSHTNRAKTRPKPGSFNFK